MSDLPETFVEGFHDEAEVRKMKYTKFGDTGLLVSQLSIGTGGFCLLYGEYTLDECKATLHEAIKKGINYIDTAPFYGNGISEEVLGKCLEGIPRKAYYLATKIGRYSPDPKIMFNFSASKTRQSIETSLKRLGCGYIDILQAHDVEFAPAYKIVLEETLPTMKEAQDAGKVRFIGVTGYPVSVLNEIIKQSKVKLDMVLCYTRLSLIDNTLKEYLQFFQSKKMGIVNAAVHCMGLLSSAGPQDWHPATQDIRDVCTEARNYCKSKGVELGKLALYYALQQVGPHTILVGMNTRELLKLNLDVFLNGLNPQEQLVYDEVLRIMKKLKVTHWEGVELERYWKSVKG